MQRVQVHPMTVRPASGRPRSDPEEARAAATLSPFYPLGCLLAYARTHQGGALNEVFDLGRVTPTSRPQLLQQASELPPDPGVFLFSSYVWNHAANLEIAAEVKRRSPGSLVVFGGPHIPRRRADVVALFAENPWLDVVTRGEGEITLAELLAALAEAGLPERLADGDLRPVAGVSYRGRGDDVVQTPDRERTRELDRFPSPYLSGEFEHWIDGVEYAQIETNRGCPYGCTFCDWGAATLAKIHCMTDERVFGEIEYLARRKTFGLILCDANFGILKRDLEITRYIVETHEKLGYPKDVAYTNAKNANDRFFEIIHLLRDAGLTKAGQISMQTVDSNVLEIANRSNIRTSEYRRMIRRFHQEDIPATSDMMIGLPGQTLETTKKDLQFFFDHMVTTSMHATTVMPNAPMADPEYRERYGIVVDDEAFVESTYSFTREEYQRILALCYAYKFFVKVGVAKYLLYFLQREHGVPAIEFLSAWLEEGSQRHPISRRVRRKLLDRTYHSTQKHWLVVAWFDPSAAFLFDDPEPFHREIVAFCEERFGVRTAGPDLECAVAVQQAVLPNKARRFPARIELQHDFVAYFLALRRLGGIAQPFEAVPPLREFGPGVLTLPEQPPCESYEHMDIDPVIGRFEVASDLSC